MDETAKDADKSKNSTVVYDSARYSPSINDVMVVKGYLFKKFDLPIELIDTIIDAAEYWPHTTTTTNRSTTIRAQRDRENQFILRSYPLGFLPTEGDNQEYQMLPESKHAYQSMEPEPWPESRQAPVDAIDATKEVLEKWATASQPRGEHPCRKIVFTIRSRDQGWGGGSGRGTYKDSFTWFDAGMERVTALRETHFLETWGSAPLPQFRLDTIKTGSPQNLDLETPNNPMGPIVCSLRTVFPHTIDSQKVSGTQHDYTSRPPLSDDDSAPKYSFEHPLNPSGSALQKNVAGSREAKEHIITWSSNDNINPESLEAKELENVGRGRETGTGEAVRNRKVGDVITVWAKARYGGWVNHIEEVKIDVYWAVYTLALPLM